ncbi:MAG TPA: hypothetical protein PKC65_10815 [Pyrinomonadaceae bacterium]|nr:hypothetical protein [Pyrinomonadaceae bacterium]
MKYLVQIIFCLILVVLGYGVVPEALSANLIAEGIVLFVGLIIVQIGLDLYNNLGRWKLVAQCTWHSLFDRSIRFSMSYQYRIKIKDKYLLVKNSNWDFYQHVGGKYKRLPITQKVLADFGAIDDPRMPTHGLMKDDLAVFVPARNAIKFLDWFSRERDREVSHWREFYEELIDGKAKVLSQKNFPYVNYAIACTIQTPIKQAEGWDCLEILQYDILDILPTLAQQQELEELYQQGDTDYVKWASKDLIDSLGYDRHQRKEVYRIGKHAKWVVNQQWCID